LGWDKYVKFLNYLSMVQNINLIQVSLDDMSSIIRDILAEELKKFGEYLKPQTTDNEELKQHLTREEVCKMLDVSTTTLFLWNKSKILVNYKLGRRVYYKKSEVFNFHNQKN